MGRGEERDRQRKERGREIYIPIALYSSFAFSNAETLLERLMLRMDNI